MEMEPGLALMDEIGRTALTNAFIQFSRENTRINPYKPLYSYTPELLPDGEEDTSRDDGEMLVNQNAYNANCNLRKCPSDPYIQKGFHSSTKVNNNTGASDKYENVPSMIITPASVSNSTSWQGGGGSAVQITINHQQQKLDNSTPANLGSFTPSENYEYERVKLTNFF